MARLLRQAEVRAVDLLRSHRADLDGLVDLLLEQETVDGSQVYRITGREDRSHDPSADIAAPHRAASSGVALQKSASVNIAIAVSPAPETSNTSRALVGM